ncbi:MAG: transcriptional repressor [Deltaproteobacteria bacterium]|nr:MAG: transcriptional repressor [Deltaproteobacteria bacterium]
MKSRQEPPLLHGKLKGYGYRMTQGREAVVNALAGAKDHLSAEDIYMKVHPAYPAIGLTSVYRTLEVLVSTGLVYKFDFGDGRARYEIAEGPRGEGHHHHLVCTGCGRIIDYADFIDEELALLKKTEAGLSKKYNFTIINHLIQFYGFCNKCKTKKNEK